MFFRCCCSCFLGARDYKTMIFSETSPVQMMFFHRWLNKYTIHWQFMIIHELWKSIIFLISKLSLVIALPSFHPTHTTPERHHNAFRAKVNVWATPKSWCHFINLKKQIIITIFLTNNIPTNRLSPWHKVSLRLPDIPKS